jgi:hypothetical protein
MNKIKSSKCILWLTEGFYSLLKQCNCVNINEDDFNPFKQKI